MRTTERHVSRRIRRRPSRRRRRRRRAALGCGLFLLLPAGVVVFLVYEATYVPPEAHTPAAPLLAGPGEASLEVVGAEIEAAAEAAREGRSSEVRVTLTEDQVSAALARAEDVTSVRNAQVEFADGAVTASGLVTWRGRELYLTVRAIPEVSERGRAEVRVVEVRSGRLRLPDSVAQRVEREMQTALDSTASGIRLENVRVGPGELTFIGNVSAAPARPWVPPQLGVTLPPSGEQPAVGSARAEVEAAIEAARRGEPSEVTITLTDAEVTAALAARGELRGVRDPRVEFTDGAVIASGLVRREGREAYITVTAVPTVTASGRPQVRVTDVRAGRLGIPVPGGLAERVGEKIQKVLDSKAPGIRLRSIEVERGRITLSGTAIPPLP